MQIHFSEISGEAVNDYKAWAESVSSNTIQVSGVNVLACSFFHYAALEWTVTKDSIPGWAAFDLVVAGLFFLCWIMYTVQCRHYVIELEKHAMEDERNGAYHRVGARGR